MFMNKQQLITPFDELEFVVENSTYLGIKYYSDRLKFYTDHIKDVESFISIIYNSILQENNSRRNSTLIRGRLRFIGQMHHKDGIIEEMEFIENNDKFWLEILVKFLKNKSKNPKKKSKWLERKIIIRDSECQKLIYSDEGIDKEFQLENKIIFSLSNDQIL